MLTPTLHPVPAPTLPLVAPWASASSLWALSRMPKRSCQGHVLRVLTGSPGREAWPAWPPASSRLMPARRWFWVEVPSTLRSCSCCRAWAMPTTSGNWASRWCATFLVSPLPRCAAEASLLNQTAYLWEGRRLYCERPVKVLVHGSELPASPWAWMGSAWRACFPPSPARGSWLSSASYRPGGRTAWQEGTWVVTGGTLGARGRGRQFWQHPRGPDAAGSAGMGFLGMSRSWPGT